MSIDHQNFKIALVHDWLMGIGGAEKTLKELHGIFPEAPIYTLFHDKKFTGEFLPNAKIIPSFLQTFADWPIARKLFTPLMPVAIESFDLSDFDLVISSSVTFSKGLILKPKTRHICYCYSPTRQIWDWWVEYRDECRMPNFAIALFQHFMRIWDRHASTRVDEFIAISENVQRRIKKYYDRDSTVIYPPSQCRNCLLPAFGLTCLAPEIAISAEKRAQREGNIGTGTGYFLIVSRLFKHKNTDLAIRAFNKLAWPLVIIGQGSEYKKLKKLCGPTIKMLGLQTDDVVAEYYSNCLGFIMPQEEDFGITPIEAMSYGKPVLALRRGGALEYIQEGINGEFFEDLVEEVLADGIRRLSEGIMAGKYNPEIIKKTTEKFSAERFKKEIERLVLGMKEI